MKGEMIKNLLGVLYRIINLDKDKIHFFIDSFEEIANYGKLNNDIGLAKLLNKMITEYDDKFVKQTEILSQELKGAFHDIEKEADQ